MRHLFVSGFSRCGNNNLGESSFITGSTNKNELNLVGHWPWMASIGIFNGKGDWEHKCGATLISNRHFLTAAHCFLLQDWYVF